MRGKKGFKADLFSLLNNFLELGALPVKPLPWTCQGTC